MIPIRQEFMYGKHKVVLETGRIARQATGAVLVSMDDTVVLCTVVAEKRAKPGLDFFPLTVDYQEKTYAAGKIPGGFFRREGRPSEKETLTSRLIDRPIRPLFPDGFTNETQVICTVMSIDKAYEADVAALIGASAALAIAGVPFQGPIAAARVGYRDGEYLLNPSSEELASSDLLMIVAGTRTAVLMVESEAKELTEDQMLGGVLFGHQEMQVVIDAIDALVAKAGKPRWDWQAPEKNVPLHTAVEAFSHSGLGEAYRITDKQQRYARIGQLKRDAVEALAGEGDGKFDSKAVEEAFGEVESNIVRQRVLNGEPRIDGRDLRTVRPIKVEVGVLPKTHGSAMFTRGETQAIVTTTLGTLRDSALIDSLAGSYKDYFLFHYNFPPFCVGEVGRNSGPRRREIGHGRLARRGVEAVVPRSGDFPYTLRVVSEITESNGSSSMASVCGASLALMDAGVPLTAPVAGVAMGLVKEGNRFAVLTDILGDEDHLGDMDFKVAGTADGVTALQMDIKIQGITEEIMEAALAQAHEARVHILGEMNKVISKPRESLSVLAPSLIVIKVHPDKIRDIIGKGGATIRSITEETGASVDIDDDGSVRIYGENQAVRDAAVKRVLGITAEAEIGRIYRGTVIKIVDFGAFVAILPGKEGLLHISQISEQRIERVEDVLQVGQEIDVVVLDLDNRGRIKLSMREVANYREPAEA